MTAREFCFSEFCNLKAFFGLALFMQDAVKGKHRNDGVSPQQENQGQKRALQSHVTAATVCATKPAFFFFFDTL